MIVLYLMHLCTHFCVEYNLGETLSHEVVDDVRLPPWASSPEDFVRKHTMALVSGNRSSTYAVYSQTQWCIAVQLSKVDECNVCYVWLVVIADICVYMWVLMLANYSWSRKESPASLTLHNI